MSIDQDYQGLSKNAGKSFRFDFVHPGKKKFSSLSISSWRTNKSSSKSADNCLLSVLWDTRMTYAACRRKILREHNKSILSSACLKWTSKQLIGLQHINRLIYFLRFFGFIFPEIAELRGALLSFFLMSHNFLTISTTFFTLVLWGPGEFFPPPTVAFMNSGSTLSF